MTCACIMALAVLTYIDIKVQDNHILISFSGLQSPA